ncbi:MULTISPECIES: hypothetical protein [Bacteroidales]|uniref:hypothetical protein n=1 Tax=Bacteroidales TaxID=171549 RepID=UPI0023548E45|nr:hypothetical protein [Barnesiella viscericola]
MKRRSNGTPLRTCFFFSHPFVGRYAFVERLFRSYLAMYQHIICPHQQFNAFSPLIKSAREATGDEHCHPQASRTDFRPADRQGKADVAGEKKKATDNSRHHRRHRHRLLGNKKP